MSATLGGLIKDYRLQKNLSQMEVSFSLGWKEPSRLSRIEQGRVGSPSRKLIDRIIKALKISEEEKNDLLYAGSYLPTDEEIRRIRKEIKPHIEKWPYPVAVYDFSWRVILMNKRCYRLFHSPVKFNFNDIDKIPTYHIFEQLFNPHYPQNIYFKGDELKKWNQFLLDVLVQFKNTQHTRTKDNWYITLMKKMMNYNLFRKFWKDAQDYNYPEVATNFLKEVALNPKKTDKYLYFYNFAVPFITDLRYEIEYHVPADLATFKYFEKQEK